jgi:putative Mn2+ efflux pump MntP
MGFFALFLIAIGLSMDAFAVAICQGLCMPRMNWKNGAVIALFFGGFQALMPLIGWLLGSQFSAYIQSIDHWVAFILLGLIGGNMIREAVEPEEEETACAVTDRLDLRRLLLMAVATSIDALAIGVSFACMKVEIVPAVCFIGVTTFVLSTMGTWVGGVFGTRFKNKAEFAGGAILVLMGGKILLEHLGILS